ncbi:MAG: hypothetical protein WC313_00560 [Candidatus Kapaibacterium sp.]
MKKYLILYLLITILTFSKLHSQTIWLQDNTNSHKSMITFYNSLIDDLKVTKFKQYLMTVNKKSQIKEEKGDIVIELHGLGTSTSSGNITYFYWVGYLLDDNLNWSQISSTSCIFSDGYIYKNSREMRNDIVKYLEDNFKNEKL